MDNAQNMTEAAQVSEAEAKLVAVTNIKRRLAEIETMTQSLKSLYDEKERLTLALMSHVGLGTEVQEGDLIFSVVDNFAAKNVVFRPTAVRRFDLEVDSAFARQEKANKEAEKLAKKAAKNG